MPNVLSGSPFVIDTPGAGVLIAAGIKLDVFLIRWVSPGAVSGHSAMIKDAFGNVKWESVATGSNYVEADHLGPEAAWFGLIVPTLGSGRLYIYHS